MAGDTAITDEMRKHIGARLFPDFPPEEVTSWGIRRYIEATTDENPLWQDEEYARSSRWGGITAPPGLLEAFNPSNHAFRCLPDLSHMALPFDPPFPRMFSAFNEWRFFAPLRPGDMITSICKLGDIYEKNGNSGRMVFTRMDNEHRNQRDELVGITSEATVSMEGSAPKRESGGEPPPPRKVESLPPTLKQVYFDDVEMGEPLPPIVKEITLYTILKWAAAVNDYGPHHFDYKFATEFLGVRDVIAHGPSNTANMAQLVTNWIGAHGMLKRHYAEMRGNVFPGDTLTFEGKVSGKRKEEGESLVDCETWADNQNGRRVLVGESTVSLPMKRK